MTGSHSGPNITSHTYASKWLIELQKVQKLLTLDAQPLSCAHKTTLDNRTRFICLFSVIVTQLLKQAYFIKQKDLVGSQFLEVNVQHLFDL